MKQSSIVVAMAGTTRQVWNNQQAPHFSGRLTELCPSDTSVAQNSIKHYQSFHAGATVAGTGFQSSGKIFLIHFKSLLSILEQGTDQVIVFRQQLKRQDYCCLNYHITRIVESQHFIVCLAFKNSANYKNFIPFHSQEVKTPNTEHLGKGMQAKSLDSQTGFSRQK